MAAHGKKSRNQMGPSDNVVDASHPTVRDDAIEVLSPLVSDGDLGPKSEVTSVTARSSQPGSETALAAALASMNSNNQVMFKQFGDALKALTTRLDEMTEGPGSGSEYSSDEGDAPVDAPNAPSEDTLSQRMRSLLPATPESGVIRDTPPSPRPSPSTVSMVPGESVQPPPNPPASLMTEASTRCCRNSRRSTKMRTLAPQCPLNSPMYLWTCSGSHCRARN